MKTNIYSRKVQLPTIVEPQTHFPLPNFITSTEPISAIRHGDAWLEFCIAENGESALRQMATFQLTGLWGCFYGVFGATFSFLFVWGDGGEVGEWVST